MAENGLITGEISMIVSNRTIFMITAREFAVNQSQTVARSMSRETTVLLKTMGIKCTPKLPSVKARRQNHSTSQESSSGNAVLNSARSE
jgi:hypothetical protein